jgi:hypothetical protein
VLWAGVLLSALAAWVVAAVVRLKPGREPDSKRERLEWQRRSLMALVTAVGAAGPLAAHAALLLLASGGHVQSQYAMVAFVTTALPHALLVLHLRTAAERWLAGDFATRPLTPAIGIAAAVPGIVLILPTVLVCVVASVLHAALRRWAQETPEHTTL